MSTRSAYFLVVANTILKATITVIKPTYRVLCAEAHMIDAVVVMVTLAAMVAVVVFVSVSWAPSTSG